MAQTFTSILIITVISFLAPLIAQSIPRKPVPETVLLLLAGAVIGKNVLGLIDVNVPIQMLSDFGLAFLFLLAGYEIDPKDLTDSEGKRGLDTWIVSFGLAFAISIFLPIFAQGTEGPIVAALILTTTALGTLMPILQENNLLGTRVGELVIKYGTWGELGPVLAMALLLSSRSSIETSLILLAFVVLAAVIAIVGARSKSKGAGVYRFLEENADSTSQTTVRATVMVLIALVAFSAIFDLGIVLGAFAAGFVLRFIVPEGNKRLEYKLNAMAYGFFIPIFFVVSGAKVNLLAVGRNPGLLVVFILMLILLRTIPVYVALATGKTTRDLSRNDKLSVALYCTTALPIVVAVTSVATDSGFMSIDVASVLVAAAAVTVLIMPLLASVAHRVSDVRPVEAVREMRADPDDRAEIWQRHVQEEQEALHARRDRARRVAKMHHDQFMRQADEFARIDFTRMPQDELQRVRKAQQTKVATLLDTRERRLRQELDNVARLRHINQIQGSLSVQDMQTLHQKAVQDIKECEAKRDVKYEDQLNFAYLRAIEREAEELQKQRSEKGK